MSHSAEDPADLLSEALACFGPCQKKRVFSDADPDESVFPHRELQREKVWSRIHLVPLLLAEGDRDAYRRQEATLERERVIMKDVKDWEVGAGRCASSRELMDDMAFRFQPGKSVYNGTRYRSVESIVVL